jgi:hypothetical protein
MKTLISFSLLIFASCVHSQDIALNIYPDNNRCQSSYLGLSIPYTDNYKGTCEEYKETWINTINGFNKFPTSWINGTNKWRVIFVNSGGESFKLPQGWVYGATSCDSKVILLGTIKALPHEFGHVLDCEGGVPQIESFKHLHWRERGWCDIISQLSTLPVKCEED